MRIHTSDKAIAYITLLSGLTISAVAIYYSVAGLTAIFSAAVIPIIVMGIALEISKLAATVWLKQNWTRAPNFIRGYLLSAIAILMIITSMGIFGFLSKAHSDQSLVSGDVLSKISVYDEKIKTEKENIEANRKALKQMDEGVDQVLGRSTDEKGADKAVALRKSQQKERTRLQNEISQSQKSIAELNDARAPIAAEVRKVEAEVGPIKYIAAFVYGDTNETILEKAVTWVIIIIVIVFDPLAVILLLASQYSFQWFRKQEDEDDEQDVKEWFEAGKERARELDQEAEQNHINEANTLLAEIPKEEPTLESVGVEEEFTEDDYDNTNVPVDPNPHPVGWMYPKHADIQSYQVEDADEEPLEIVITELPTTNEEEEVILDSVHYTEKAAMSAWKHDHPNDSLKRQRAMFDQGFITELPWKKYIVDEAVKEAQKWAEENPESDETKQAKEWAEEKNGLTYMENIDGQQIKKTVDGYTQNAEQSSDTLWQRIQDSKK